MTLRIGPEELVDRLAALRRPGPTGIAFDADGTLWSGDVGEDVFEFAYQHGLLREEARAELARVATAHGIPARGTPSELARAIHGAYRRGDVDERLTCEVMTWSYSGFTEDELRKTARDAFDARGLRARVRQILEPARAWATHEEVRSVVVSASPRLVVVEALAFVGIDVFAVAGALPAMSGDSIAPKMAAPVPYAADKLTAGFDFLSGHDWLASFGDNTFDLELLRAARVGVAVCPKPGLLSRIGELASALVLE